MIRPETQADYAAIATVLTQAFERENEAQLVDRIRKSDRYIPSLSLIAERDGMVSGYCLFSYIDLVSTKTHQVLALAPVAVQPSFQNQGIGSALVRSGLAIADSLGEALVVVLGHPQFYPRFGFAPAVQYGVVPPFLVPENAFMVKPLQHYQDIYRGNVSYPPAFNDV